MFIPYDVIRYFFFFIWETVPLQDVCERNMFRHAGWQ